MTRSQRGFTMIEALVSIAASSVLVVGLGLGFSVTMRTFSLVAEDGTDTRAAATGVEWWMHHARHADGITQTDSRTAAIQTIAATQAETDQERSLTWSGVGGNALQTTLDRETPSDLPGAVAAFSLDVLATERAGTGYSSILPSQSARQLRLSRQGILFRLPYDEIVVTFDEVNDLFTDQPLQLATSDIPDGWQVVRNDRFMVWLRGDQTTDTSTLDVTIDTVGGYEFSVTFRLDGSDVQQSGVR